MADIITQAELQAVWTAFNDFGNTIIGIRRRIEAGVPVEPGFIHAESDGPLLSPIEDHLRTDL
jgi:hypothetical protein